MIAYLKPNAVVEQQQSKHTCRPIKKNYPSHNIWADDETILFTKQVYMAHVKLKL